jgi:ADP-ribose pyrophosphatase YjhB (NUDIX family)
MYDVYHWQQKMFDGSFETFEMLKRVDTVKVLAIKDGKIVTLDEQQPGHDHYFAYPGGRHDQDHETELQAAQRELHEETGFIFRDWKLVNIYQPSDEVEWFFYNFVATGFVRQDDHHPDTAGEKVKVRLMDFDELKALSRRPEGYILRRPFLDHVDSIDQLQALPEINP